MLDIFKGRSVLVTGHTGFKGSWLTFWLNRLGAKVIGLGLDPRTEHDSYYYLNVPSICEDLRVDVRNYDSILSVLKKYKPEIIFHLAAQPLVLESYKNPLFTYETNVIGTANLLESIRNTNSVKQVVIVTTDKVYENKEFIWGYRENDSLGGYEPYGTSKAAAEMVVSGYRHSFFNPEKYHEHKVSVATARAGNVIGGGDWAENRIVPDCIKSLIAGRAVEVRNPSAIRPWQMVLEALGGYLLLAARMNLEPSKYCEAWNFGPGLEGLKDVKSLVNSVMGYWGDGRWEIPQVVNPKYESGLLALDISKSRIRLGWEPVLSFQEAVEFTVAWYRAQSSGEDMVAFTHTQLDAFENRIEHFFSKK